MPHFLPTAQISVREKLLLHLLGLPPLFGFLFSTTRQACYAGVVCGPLGLTMITFSLSTMTAPGAEPFTFLTNLQGV